jgi:hypothetical protein
MSRLAPGTRSRRVVIALCIWAVCTAVYFAVDFSVARTRLTQHTQFNHFALLADAWLHGRLDLPGPPPGYTENNDFAEHQGRWYVSFPAFPAVLLLPIVKLAGSPENVRDAQFWLWFGGIGPAAIFLMLEKLRRLGHADTGERTNVALALLFAFGTVYFFTAEQGTVWFAAHVVGVALESLFLLFAIGAERPVLAGLCIALAFNTRTPMLPASLFLGLEAVRTSLRSPVPAEGSFGARLAATVRAIAWGPLLRKLVLFSIPLLVVLGICFWHNQARFGRALEFGHKLLTVGWRDRIQKWGLFSYHYFPRNLGIFTSSLPYVNPTPPRVQINTHGLALWFTTPVYLWLLWPRRTGWIWWSLVASVAIVAGMDLLYQNSGWQQFGYRFSNDYAPMLFALLAIGGFRRGAAFWAAAAWSVAINAFGAATFNVDSRWYYTDGTQRIIYQPD